MRKSMLAMPVALLALGFTANAQNDRVPSGTSITVRTNDAIDLKNPPSDGRIYTAVVDQDVRDRNGRVVIPRGSDAELVVRNINDDEVALDMESVTVNGRRYMVSTEEQQLSGESSREREGVGKNERTAKYIGGGALLGTIVGAIAGGGKGAAIGAAAGAGAGAATQTMTRGRSVSVPSESLLTFRLDRPLVVRQGSDFRDNRYGTGNRNDSRRQYRYR